MSILLLVMVAFSERSAAQAWSGILDQSRAIDWTQAGVPGGPRDRTTICGIPSAPTSPISPSGDTTGANDTTNVNTAIANCPPEGVVQLTAGTFYAGPTSGFTFGATARNNVTLRGAGPDQTKVYVLAGTPCGFGSIACIVGSTGSAQNYPVTATTQWTGNYAKGTTVLAVGSVTGMNVCTPGTVPNSFASCPSGSIIILDQDNSSLGVLPAAYQPKTVTPTCLNAGVAVACSTLGATTSYQYVVQAIIQQGVPYCPTAGGCPSPPSPASLAVTNVTAMDGTNTYNTITNWTPTGNAVEYSSCNVYQTAPQALFIGTMPSCNNGAVLRDNGAGTPGTPATPTVIGASQVGSTVTIVTTFAHGFNVGDCVAIGDISPMRGPSMPTSATILVGYNSNQNTSVNCTQFGVTKTGWPNITAVGCVIAPATSFTPAASCGANPINAFQYTATNTGLPLSGGGRVSVDTGGVYWCEVPDGCVDEHAAQGRRCPDSRNNLFCGGSTTGGNSNSGIIKQRDQMEIKRVVDICGSSAVWQVAQSACTPNTIQIDPSVHMTNWRAALNPGIYWTGNYAVGDSVEGITFDVTRLAAQSARGGIMMYNGYGNWVKNVRTLYTDRNHTWIVWGARNTIRDNYFFGTKGGQTQSYGMEEFDGSSDDLFENNMCQHVAGCMMSGGNSGSVVAYNFGFDAGYYAVHTLLPLTNMNHDWAAYTLSEGNDTNVIIQDSIHGNSIAVTSFRNRLRNVDVPMTTTGGTQYSRSPLRAFQINSFNRAANTVNNVLSSPVIPVNTLFCTNYGDSYCIYNVGAKAEGYNVTSDTIAVNSFLRWGNFNLFSNVTHWCGGPSNTGWAVTGNQGCNSTSEIPQTGLPYGINANPIPTLGDTGPPLPASFYLSGQPLFWQTAWGTPGWPAIGSDVTATGSLNATCTIDPLNPFACDGIANHSYQIPSQICMINTPIDSAYQQSFSITNITFTSATAKYLTVTTAGSPPAGWMVGQGAGWGGTNGNGGEMVTLSGVNPPVFNGIYGICSSISNCPAPTTTQFSVLAPTDPGTSSYVQGTGTVSWPSIRNFNAANCYVAAYTPTPQPPTTVPSIINGHGQITGQGKIT